MTRVLAMWVIAVWAGLATPCLGQASEDPVLLARAQRAEARGIPEGDLPPVPRSILEPPPLPPPELHPRDMKGSRATRASRKGGRTTKAKPGKKRRSPSKSRTKSPR